MNAPAMDALGPSAMVVVGGAALEAEKAETTERLARVDVLDDVVRRYGPRLADPDDETRELVVREVGAEVRLARSVQ